MNMCEGPILPKMLKFAVPLMLSSILQLLFNAADVVVVGKFAGDDALAASVAVKIVRMVRLMLGNALRVPFAVL